MRRQGWSRFGFSADVSQLGHPRRCLNPRAGNKNLEFRFVLEFRFILESDFVIHSSILARIPVYGRTGIRPRFALFLDAGFANGRCSRSGLWFGFRGGFKIANPSRAGESVDAQPASGRIVSVPFAQPRGPPPHLQSGLTGILD